MDSLTGKTIRWRFVDDPTAGTTYEHSFNADGTVTWRIVDGQYKGATAKEKSYGAVRINDRTWAISYLGASGHTLTVVLNLDNGRMVGFASNEKSWYSLNGTFEVMN
jgi:phenolic acid decarboxylase